MSEKKETLPDIHSVGPPLPPKSPFKRRLIVALCLVSIWLPASWFFRTHSFPNLNASWSKNAKPTQCQQVDPLFPSLKSKDLSDMDSYLKTSKFRNESIARLSGAVKIPTQSYDDMGAIEEDPRWDIFFSFAEYLKGTFPAIHFTLELDVVNTHGLVYTWQGSNDTLKPLLLMAHQDVVPVPESTVNSWTFPPFSGAYDGKHVWGRGASDCKNSLIAILESIELLIQAGFKPSRTIVLSFGFDEEISGREGAGHLAPYLLNKYGKGAFAAIVDEGAGVNSLWGTHFATPGVAEKGYVDIEIIVRMPGGHSSIPPAHNGIGVMSELITHIESNLYSPHLDSQNPYLGLLQCGAAHSPSFPKKLKKLLSKSSKNAHGCSKKGKKAKKEKKDPLALEAAKASPGIKYLMTTSVAVDVINGGVKVNALPERTTAIVNHRINIGDHPSIAKSRISALASTVAHKYNLTLHSFPSSSDGETPSSITLRAEDTELDTAPVTPTSVDGVTPYSILSGTTRALYGKEIIVAPGIMTGNTDTRYYWDLSKHIFRYVPGWDPEEEGMGNIHTVDEKMSVKAHIAAVQWFSLFIRNMDEADL